MLTIMNKLCSGITALINFEQECTTMLLENSKKTSKLKNDTKLTDF